MGYYEGSTRVSLPVAEIDVLWITAGLGCDGDTIAMTAATQPSIEDVVGGSMPWIPKVRLLNPFLSFENGDDFLARFRLAAEGHVDPFILVVEGSIPNEKNKDEGYWASLGTDSVTGQPITTCEWIDRLSPHAWAVIAAGTCATYGGIHAMEGNPTGCMVLADYLGWKWKSKAEIPIVCVPGCPVQPDNFMETLLYLLYMAAGRAPMIPLDEALRPTWLFGSTVHEGCDRGGYYEQAQFASHKALLQLTPDIEALLVNRVGHAHGLSQAEYYIAPIDDCYRLVGVIRMHWKGLSGGTEVWTEIGRFFSELRGRG
jgi:hydrogenase small subunit